MAFGLIIIGDEILSGRRVDKHFPKVLELLKERGLALSWVNYLADDPVRITETLKRTLHSDDIVLCTGGIGATPDDHTRQCAAAAAGRPLVLHPEAQELIQQRISEQAILAGEVPDLLRPDNLHRLHMGEFPQGADIIPNPYNKIPGFSLSHAQFGRSGAHYFAPGFPVMAWPMFEWVLDTFYTSLFHQAVQVEKSVFVYGAMESTLTPLMVDIEQRFAGIKVFSLPHVGDDRHASHIDLGVKGSADTLQPAYDYMLAQLDQMGARYALAAPEASARQ